MQIRKINIDTLKYEKKLLVYKSTTKISFYGQSNEDIRKWTTSQSFRHLGDTILSYQLETKEYSDTFNTTPYIYADSINYIYNGIRLGAVFSRRIFDKEKEEYNARYKRDPPTFSSIMMIYDYSPNGLLLSIRSRFSNDTTVQISRFEYKMPAHTQKREEPEDRNCSKKISVHFRNYVEYYFDDQYRECILWNTGPNWVQSRYNHGVGFDSHDTTTPKSYPYPSSISYFFHKGHKLEKVITTKMFSSTHIQNIAIKVYQNRKHTKEITYNFKNFLQGTSVFVNRNFQFIFDHVNIKVDKTDQQNEAFMYSLLGGFTPLPFKYNNTMKVKLSDEITKSYHKIIKGG